MMIRRKRNRHRFGQRLGKMKGVQTAMLGCFGCLVLGSHQSDWSTAISADVRRKENNVEINEVWEGSNRKSKWYCKQHFYYKSGGEQQMHFGLKSIFNFKYF